MKIVLQDLQGVSGQGHEALFVPLAANFQPSLAQRQILQLEF